MNSRGQLATLRERADYDIIFNADKDMISAFKPKAKELMDFIGELLL